jgi:hypothetical protein
LLGGVQLVIGALVLSLLGVEAIVLGSTFARAGRALAHSSWSWLIFALACEAASMGAFARVQRP